ncbi:MAG TPA: ribonuclease HI [Trueperaceae bacterium]|nr:ribonuclease HI [Trueperaceae bacterium]
MSGGARVAPRSSDAAADRRAVTVYTDGSCDTASGRGGWAYLLEHAGRSKTASGFEAGTTNNRMELTAAVRALEALKERCAVTLVTDSEYLKKAFTDGWLAKWQANGWRTAGRQAVKNKDLWLELLAQTARHEVTWSWTRGHAGQPQNEEVDRLALAARRQGR